MKIFVTVGTTKFDELIKEADAIHDANEWLLQTADGEYVPIKKHVKFSNEVNKLYDEADLIITHAGAGSIYNLLEQKKQIIICPNTYRVDKHQEEISRFVEENKYAKVCWDLSKLENLINENYEPEVYKKDQFFLIDKIIEHLTE